MRTGSRGRVVVTLTGLAAVALYFLGAHLSATLDPRDRLPLLDGFSPPPPYRWVSPPPALAPNNQPPQSLSTKITLGEKGSPAQVLTTRDLQASLAISNGAIPAPPGGLSVTVKIDPLAPKDVAGRLPSGFEIAGNVYRIMASYRPSGRPVQRLQAPSEVVLGFPLLTGPFGVYRLMQLVGGRWVVLHSIENAAARNVTGDIHTLGDFAVGLRTSGTASASPSTSPSGKALSKGLVWGVVALAAVVLVVLLALRRRERARPKHRGTRR